MWIYGVMIAGVMILLIGIICVLSVIEDDDEEF